MIPRLDIQFPLVRQIQYWRGTEYQPREGEYLLNHARTGIMMALRAALPNGGKVGVVAYNCHTVANAVMQAECVPVFIDVTDDLTIDIATIPADLDAIVVTNLFGIRNDIAAIRKRLPEAIIIVDNAHGYGLPAEGDFTVYSINQGKFPALGPGGILCVNLKENNIIEAIDAMYERMPGYSKVGEIKLFGSMIIKAIAYSRCMYRVTMKLKKTANLDVHEPITMKRMASGIRRLYNAWLPNAHADIEKQRQNAERVSGLVVSGLGVVIIGDNAFMAVVRTDDPEALKKDFADRGVETETHFKHCIEWAKEFGYIEGSCPKAEELTRKLLMIPTYTRI